MSDFEFDSFDFNLNQGERSNQQIPSNDANQSNFDVSHFMSNQVPRPEFFSSVQSPNFISPVSQEPGNHMIRNFEFPVQQPQFQPQMNAPKVINEPTTSYKKAKWTSDEDNLLKMMVKNQGTNNWSLIAQSIPGRTGKQCRERWLNQLRPELNKNNWTPQEDAILIQQQQIHGNMWTKIAQYLPGRSANNVKNRWSWISRHHTSASLLAQMIPLQPAQIQSPISSINRFNVQPVNLGMQTAPIELQWGNQQANINGATKRFAFSDPNGGSLPNNFSFNGMINSETSSFNENENDINNQNHVDLIHQDEFDFDFNINRDETEPFNPFNFDDGMI